MTWLELRARVSPELVEPVVDLFSRYARDAPAVEEEGGYNPDEEEEPTPGAPVTVRVFLPMDRRLQWRRARIEVGYQLLSLITPLPPLDSRTVEEREWQEVWEQFRTPLKVGRRLLLTPRPLDLPPPGDRLVILLESGMAFGTGHHPTTRMCLEELERRTEDSMRVLDLGTGSGVLSLAAARLGASVVLGVDRDPQAVRAARRSVRVNGLAKHVRVIHGDGPPPQEKGFDLVVANISARVLSDLAPRLVQSLAPGSTLVASGVLEEDGREVAEKLAGAGLVGMQIRAEEGWVVITGSRAAVGR